jgi:GTP pyrophosphokinase
MWFKKEKREENIIHGKMAFEAELRHAKINISDVTDEEVLPKILERVSYNSIKELYAAIGYGGISARRVVNRIRDELHAAAKLKTKEEQAIPSISAKPKARPAHGVLVEGLENCLVKFAKCCAPVPGDPVIGFITRGYGVSVHRRDCVNYINSSNLPDEEGRWINVQWADTDDKLYSSIIQVDVRDRDGVVVDIATVINALKIRITSFNAKQLEGGSAHVMIDVEVKHRDELIGAMAKIMSIKGVIDVRRN